MRLLLDTHVFLWAVSAHPRLKAETRSLIQAADEVYVSAASIWEIAIKHRLGKINVAPDELAAVIEPSGFIGLPVRAAHAAGVSRLPMHHNDPFDRLLLAQALHEPLKLVTADALLTHYSDIVVLVP